LLLVGIVKKSEMVLSQRWDQENGSGGGGHLFKKLWKEGLKFSLLLSFLLS
jgi:hypothetical protein